VNLTNRVKFYPYYLNNGLECGLNNFGGSVCDLTDRLWFFASDLTNNGLDLAACDLVDRLEFSANDLVNGLEFPAYEETNRCTYENKALNFECWKNEWLYRV